MAGAGTIGDLPEQGVGFRSISDGMIDTTSASGELVFHIFSALAQFERRLIQERTKAGIAAARARGRKGGRPRLAQTEPRILLAKKLHADGTGEMTVDLRTLIPTATMDAEMHMEAEATEGNRISEMEMDMDMTMTLEASGD